MIKLRVMGTRKELRDIERFLTEEQTAYEVSNVSKMYRNKGTNVNRRMYAELTRNSEEKENDKNG